MTEPKAVGGVRGNGSAGSIAFGIAVVLAIVALAWPRFRETLPPDEFQPARLLGKPLRMTTDGGERVFLLSEQVGRHWFWGHGTGGRRWSSPASEQVLHQDLWAFEPGQALPLWRRRYVDNPPDNMTDVGDILVGQGGLLRLQLRLPARVDARDGRTLAATDPVDGPELRGDEVYDLRDLQARGLRTGDRWTGLLTAREQAKLAGPDGAAWRPDALGPVGEAGEYSLWTAQVRDRAEAWGRVEEYSGFRRLDGAPVFLAAGLLRPAQRADPAQVDGDVLVVHRQDATPQARLVMSRVAVADGRVAWSAVLPFATLRHLLPGAPQLALVGTEARDPAAPGERPPEWLAFIDLRDGSQQRFDLGQASLGNTPPPLP